MHASEVVFTTGTCLFGIKYLRLVIEIYPFLLLAADPYLKDYSGVDLETTTAA